MNIELKVSLCRSIHRWLNNVCVTKGWDVDAYIYDDISEDMANAAASVFDANIKGQQFEREQK